MSVQTSYASKAITGRKGQLADNDDKIVEAAHANGTPTPGNLVLLSGPTAGALEAADATPLPALTVAATAILATAGASATSAQTLVTTALNGAVGLTHMNPARRISITCDSHSDWDPTIATVRGLDVMGNDIYDVVNLASSSANATKKFFASVYEIDIPAQTGTGGTFTAGVTANEGVYHPATVGVLIRDTAKEPLSSTDALADNDRCDVLKVGKIFVSVEAAVTAKGLPAYLRTLTSGNNLMGQWSPTAASGFTLQPWAFFDNLSDSDSIAVLRKAL